MQVVAAGVRRPLEANESGKASRLVGVFRGLDRLAPGATIGGGAGQRHQFLREGALREATMISMAASAPCPTGSCRTTCGPSGRRANRACPRKGPEKIPCCRSDRNNHKVERTRELYPLAAGSNNLFSFAKPIGIFRTEPGAERAGIHRKRRVQVRIAEKRPSGKIPSRVRRIWRFARESFGGLLLVERADVSLHLRQHWHSDGGGLAAAIFMKSRRLIFFDELKSDFFFAIVPSRLSLANAE